MSIAVGGVARWHAQMTFEQAFDPEATHAMAVAFVGARWVLGLGSRPGESTIRLAQRVVDAATSGERNPWRLRAEVIRQRPVTPSAMQETVLAA